jgi:hypothetical protein
MSHVSSGKHFTQSVDVLHRIHNRMRAQLATRTLSMQARPYVKAEANAIAWAIEQIQGKRPEYESVDLRPAKAKE